MDRADLKCLIPDHFSVFDREEMPEVYKEINKDSNIQHKGNAPEEADLEPLFVQDG